MKRLVLTAVWAFMSLMACDVVDNKDDAELAVAGYAQKGQLIKGSTVTAFALGEGLVSTGKVFPSTITDNLGSFALMAETGSPYLELRAEGYYFVENTGKISEAPIYLSALVSSSQKDVNINLLTTVTCARIKKIMAGGKSFAEAKVQAEAEALTALSLQSGDLEVGFENMDISKAGSANAVLLAISCQIQEGRNSGEIQKLVSDISSDFEVDGKLSETLLDEIFNREVNVSDVLENLMEFYEANGLQDYEIPPFYQFVDKGMSEGFNIIGPVDECYEIYNVDIAGGIREFKAVSFEGFTVESDVDWVKVKTAEIYQNLYELTIDIEANPDFPSREGNVYVKSGDGAVLYVYTVKQKGNGQRLIVKIPGNITKSSAETRTLKSGDRVNVNGEDYELAYDSGSGEFYVDVPKSDKGYGVTTTPDIVVPAPNGDPLCATVKYDGREYFFGNEGDASVETRLSAGENRSVIPYYGALKPMQGMELSNPAVVELENVAGALSLEFRFDVSMSGEGYEISGVEVEIGEDGFLVGEITTCMYPDKAVFYPTYVVPETEYRNKSAQEVFEDSDGDNKIAFLMHPQKIEGITVRISLSKGVTYTFQTLQTRECQRGKRYSLVLKIGRDMVELASTTVSSC